MGSFTFQPPSNLVTKMLKTVQTRGKMGSKAQNLPGSELPRSLETAKHTSQPVTTRANGHKITRKTARFATFRRTQYQVIQIFPRVLFNNIKVWSFVAIFLLHCILHCMCDQRKRDLKRGLYQKVLKMPLSDWLLENNRYSQICHSTFYLHIRDRSLVPIK